MKKCLLILSIICFSALVPNLTLAEECTGDNSCYRIELRESIGSNDAITGGTGMELTKNYIAILYKYGASIIGIICVLIIVISGIQIITGGASSEGVTQAKTRIFNSLLSLMLLFFSAMILKTINPGFFRRGLNIERQEVTIAGDLAEKPGLCSIGSVPPSCYNAQGQRNPGACKAEGPELCRAIGLPDKEGNCVKDLQNTLSAGNFFSALPACAAGIGNLVDGAYGNCTKAAFELWNEAHCQS
ncbi:hypothetical protein K9M41_00705 [Candidatus Gracilibacteria bacterium]|nr:hypothetical protein [Candidatus Gracilibacteria bacterium]